MSSEDEYNRFAHLYDLFKSDDDYDLLVDILERIAVEHLDCEGVSL